MFWTALLVYLGFTEMSITLNLPSPLYLHIAIDINKSDRMCLVWFGQFWQILKTVHSDLTIEEWLNGFLSGYNIFQLLPCALPLWSATSGSVLSKNNAAGSNIATGRPSMQLSQTTFVLLPPPPKPSKLHRCHRLGLLSSCLLETKQQTMQSSMHWQTTFVLPTSF